MKLRIALASALALLSGAMSSVVAVADPDAVETARAQLEKIHSEASAIDQQVIEATSRVEDAEKKLTKIKADLAVQEKRVEKLSSEIGDLAVLQMHNDPVSVAAQLLSSNDSDKFLSGLGIFQSEVDRSNASVQQLQLGQAKLASLKTDAENTEKTLKEERDTKVKLAKEYDDKEAQAKAVYDRLSAEERQRLAELETQRAAAAASPSRSQTSTGPATSNPEADAFDNASSTPAANESADSSSPASSRAQQAVQIALAQVGKPYVWGATGPNSFDCSGLMLYAYRSVGVSLPRVASAQAGAGRYVSKSELKPGDLVFFYSPISHVGMYIGDGKIVHASNPRTGVIVSSLASSPRYNTAVRVVD